MPSRIALTLLITLVAVLTGCSDDVDTPSTDRVEQHIHAISAYQGAPGETIAAVDADFDRYQYGTQGIRRVTRLINHYDLANAQVKSVEETNNPHVFVADLGPKPARIAFIDGERGVRIIDAAFRDDDEPVFGTEHEPEN